MIFAMKRNLIIEFTKGAEAVRKNRPRPRSMWALRNTTMYKTVDHIRLQPAVLVAIETYAVVSMFQFQNDYYKFVAVLVSTKLTCTVFEIPLFQPRLDF